MSKTVPISRRALIQRINRALAKEGELLKACRPNSRAYHELGEFYVVDTSANAIVGKDVDLESYARELKVLEKFEHLNDH